MVAIKKAFAGIAAVSWVWLMAGCAEVLVPGTLAGGGEAYRYSTANVAKETFIGNVDQVTVATRSALQAMGIQMQSISTDEAETEITASTAELDITIELKPITSNTTKVSVSAVEDYVLKDKATADEIIDQIQLALDSKSSPDVSLPRVFVKNHCRHPIELIVYYLAGQTGPESWQTRGWFSLDPGQKKHVADTHNRYIYFYGETPPNNKLTWTGDMLHWFEGNRYPFFKVDMGTTLEDFTQSFNCE
jgi:hypothetical protein